MISVIMPTWNCADFLKTAIDSILVQSWSNREIIVVNDGSTDDTAAILAAYGGRIKVVNIEHSGGPSRPRNVGLDAARGDFVAFFDSDDVMMGNKLESAMAVFAAQPAADLVFTSFAGIDEDGAVFKSDWLAEYRSFRRDLARAPGDVAGLLAGDLAYGHLLRINFVGTSSVVCRREIFEKAGRFEESLPNSGDLDLWRRVAWHGFTLAFLDQIGHGYRVRSGSICSRGAQRVPHMIRAYERQYPYCRNEEQRRVVRRKIRQLRSGYGWHLRRSGDVLGAQREYRSSLQLGWSPLAAVGLLRTSVQAFFGLLSAGPSGSSTEPAATRERHVSK